MCKIFSYRFEPSNKRLRRLHDHLEAGVFCHRVGTQVMVPFYNDFSLGMFINKCLETCSNIRQGHEGGSRYFKKKVIVQNKYVSPSKCKNISEQNFGTFSFLKRIRTLYISGNQDAIRNLSCPLLAPVHIPVVSGGLCDFLLTTLSVQKHSSCPDYTPNCVHRGCVKVALPLQKMLTDKPEEDAACRPVC